MTRNSRACIKPQQPLRKGARTYMDIYRYSNTMPNYKYSNTMLRQGLSVRDLAWRCWAIQEHRCGQPCVHASARHILDVPGIYDAICPQLSHNQELAPIVTQLSNWHRARRHHSISTISVNPPRALAWWPRPQHCRMPRHNLDGIKRWCTGSWSLRRWGCRLHHGRSRPGPQLRSGSAGSCACNEQHGTAAQESLMVRLTETHTAPLQHTLFETLGHSTALVVKLLPGWQW